MPKDTRALEAPPGKRLHQLRGEVYQGERASSPLQRLNTSRLPPNAAERHSPPRLRALIILERNKACCSFVMLALFVITLLSLLLYKLDRQRHRALTAHAQAIRTLQTVREELETVNAHLIGQAADLQARLVSTQAEEIALGAHLAQRRERIDELERQLGVFHQHHRACLNRQGIPCHQPPKTWREDPSSVLNRWTVNCAGCGLSCSAANKDAAARALRGLH
jgi:hypothetical protein